MTGTHKVLDVPEADLDDLRARLRRTRWARPWPTSAWAAGTDGEELRRLVDYWASAYDWREREAAGVLANRFSDDFLLTQASLYWFTNTISTSFRPYYERHHQLVPPVERVDVPTALALFPADIGGRQPRAWVERVYTVTRYHTMPRGGHFAAYEESDLLADDIAAFFGSLRWALATREYTEDGDRHA
jgi:hypothetical protein